MTYRLGVAIVYEESQAQRLEAEIEELKAALGEAHVELLVWKRSAEYRLVPTRCSR